MPESAAPAIESAFAFTKGWFRLFVALGLALAVALLLRSQWTTGPWALLFRTLTLGLIGVLVFGLFEQWPKRLPRWRARAGVIGHAFARKRATSDRHLARVEKTTSTPGTTPDVEEQAGG